MEKLFNFVHYKEVKYKLNSETRYYQKEPEKIQFLKLPSDLRIEKTVKEFLKQQGANEIITGRFKNKKREFFTGLIPIHTNFFEGDNYEFIKGAKKKSLIVFEFSDNSEYLTLNYFNHFYKESREERLNFVLLFIQHLKR